MGFSLIPRRGHFYELFEEMARKLVVASEALADLLEHFENVEAKTAQLKALEHEADTLFLNSMADMFQGEMSSVDIIKWRDIYNQLERATDSCEQVAHILEAIVLKHA